MALISDQIPNLMNGVSQQAITMRMPSQGEEQINGLSSLVEGNVKRPPIKYRAKLPNETTSEDAYIHRVNRDNQERYEVFIRDGNLSVYDLEGNPRTVNFPDGTDYLSTEDAVRGFRAVSVADYTFVVNKQKQVGTLDDLTPTNGNSAIVFLTRIDYNIDYRIFVNPNGDQDNGDFDWPGTMATATLGTPDTDGDLNMEWAVNGLSTQLRNNLGDGWIIENRAPVIHIRREDGAEFDISVQDTNRDATELILNKKGKVTDLPVTAPVGHIVQITGEETNSNNDYYVEFMPEVEDAEGLHEGYWEECVAPGIEYLLDPATMPHTLVREADGTFTFGQAEWGGRTVGDEESSPWPSFVGNTINDIYFDRRRLCILSGDSAVMSKAGGFFTFFAETVIQILDDGVIDISAPGTSVVTLRYGIPFNRKILLFSDQQQFVISDEYLIASQPPGIASVSAYESDGKAAPVGAGKTIFYPVNRGNWSGVLEYFTMRQTEDVDATDISEHVPRYIPADARKVTVSSTSKILALISDLDPTKVWVYKYHWRSNEKLQSSWSHWTVPEGGLVRSADFFGDDLYFVIDYPDGVYLESVNVAQSSAEDGEGFVYRIDRRLTESDVSDLSFDIASNISSFSIPYDPGEAELVVVTRESGGASDRPPANALTVLDVTPTTTGADVQVQGDISGTSFFVGLNYSHVYVFSEAIVRDRSSGGTSAALAAGRLQLRKWHVYTADTGYFRGEVSPSGRTTSVYPFTGSSMGAENSTIGSVDLTSGRHSMRVNSKADRVRVALINDSFLPSAFTAAEWEGRFTRNSSRP